MFQGTGLEIYPKLLAVAGGGHFSYASESKVSDDLM